MKRTVNHIFLDEFEQHYISLRRKESRLYTDEELTRLPVIAKTHTNYAEWNFRGISCRKLLAYIHNSSKAQSILEVGCGNGWLSAKLASVTTGTVTGTDINTTELEQAARVFNKQQNLSFFHCDIRDEFPGNKKFDIMVFAASIQYFSPLKEILDVALALLNPSGEIHILDSHFYRKSEIEAARQRTKNYYASMAFDVLSNYYYHHSMEELDQYHHKILFDPYSWKNKLSISKNPFHWIVIKKKAD
ncbi:class I SAM-dependent methyltransferase [soil metagenome]